MSVLQPVLDGITAAAANVSTLGGMILLVFVGIFAGRVSAAPLRSTRGRYGSSSKPVPLPKNASTPLTQEQFNQLADKYQRFQNQRNASAKSFNNKNKKPYYRKKKPFTGRVKNISARSGYLRSGVVKADDGPHSKRLAAHNAAVAQSNRDFKHWQKNASPAELNQPAIRRARPGEY